jgi:hypothetical protein
MAPLSGPRNTPIMGAGGVPVLASYPVAASTKIWPGSIVAINSSGYAVEASDTAGLTVVGICDPQHGAAVDNSAGADGAINVPVIQGVGELVNGDSITLADVGGIAYVSDDQTVVTSGTSNSIVAGIIYLVDANGVWVFVGLGSTPGTDASLNAFTAELAAFNTAAEGANLVGVQDADSNFGASPTVEAALKQLAEQPKFIVTIPIPAYSAIANSGVLATFKPGFKCRLISMHVMATTPVTTSGKAATLTPEIGGVAVTGGVVSMTSAGQTPEGAVQDGTAVTALNVVSATATVTVVASSVTAFVEGAGVIQLMFG